VLPFSIEDAARREADVEASQLTDRPFPRLGQELRLNHRWVDLRVPANHAIFKLQSAVCQLFREALYKEGFTEIHSPKLIAGESEGGSGVFRTDYFGSPACLAQSPQLYKQMAISADLNKVFEVGPVFRAENSNTRRHLCEFTGLDVEMAIHEHYDEVLDVCHATFKHMFQGLEARWPRELAAVREQYASAPVRFTEKPCVVHWPDGIAMLREAGVTAEELGDFDDLSGAQVLSLTLSQASQLSHSLSLSLSILQNSRRALRCFCPRSSILVSY
jgi:aspartyl-tRNA synthetase